MFDTIVLSHDDRGKKTPPQIERGFTFTGTRYIYNSPPERGYARPHLTYSYAPDGIGYLSVKVSLPKMLYGNNVEMISDTDIPRALDEISDFVSERAGVDFNAATAKVWRLDVCHNWRRTEEEVYARLRALRCATMPRMVFRLVESSPYWKNASQEVTAYAKLAQMQSLAREGMATDADVRASVGVFRLERRYLTSNACKRLAARLNLPDRRADYMLQERVADTVLNETMKELGLDRAIESGDSRLSLLREKYGYGSRFQRLAGFIALCDAYGADSLVALGIVSRSRFYEQKRELEAAGAWLVSPAKRTLPPLRLVRETNITRRASVIG